MSQCISILTADGERLEADISEPAGSPSAVLIINGATGVPRSFYARFAQHGALAGFAVVTYDYRGTGGSLSVPLRASKARMRDWGQRDFPAVIRWASDAYPGRPLVAIGHSVGGQLFGLTPEVARLSGLVGVASQSGNWRLSGHPVRRWLDWHVTVPLLSTVFGYLPGWAGVGMSLPKPVAQEWARWCRSANDFVDERYRPLPTHFVDVVAPVLWIDIENDNYAPPQAVEAIARRFISTRPERLTFHESRFGSGPIGHFGLFTPRFVAAWDEILAWAHQTATAVLPDFPVEPVTASRRGWPLEG